MTQNDEWIMADAAKNPLCFAALLLLDKAAAPTPAPA
jgi:hypothetical protein